MHDEDLKLIRAGMIAVGGLALWLAEHLYDEPTPWWVRGELDRRILDAAKRRAGL